MKLEIGVLGLQGAVREHVQALIACGHEGVVVKTADQMKGLRGIIIPGGESTTIGKLMVEYGLLDAVRERAHEGMGIFGTCAGMVLLAQQIEGSKQPRLGLMDMEVCRNAFGRQRESFETDLDIPILDGLYRGVFIRAPYVKRVGPGCEVLAFHEDKIVLARQGRFLASAFHPELTRDLRLHRLFAEILERPETF